MLTRPFVGGVGGRTLWAAASMHSSGVKWDEITLIAQKRTGAETGTGERRGGREEKKKKKNLKFFNKLGKAGLSPQVRKAIIKKKRKSYLLPFPGPLLGRGGKGGVGQNNLYKRKAGRQSKKKTQAGSK